VRVGPQGSRFFGALNFAVALDEQFLNHFDFSST
jgi:hypothetical protein